jgi:hypothetical protein
MLHLLLLPYNSIEYILSSYILFKDVVISALQNYVFLFLYGFENWSFNLRRKILYVFLVFVTLVTYLTLRSILDL